MYKTNEDKYYISKTEMEEKLVALLGGRAAEAIAINDISTGASNDIERASKIARAMVTKYGMSETLGTITFGSVQEEVFLGRDFTSKQNFSEELSAKIDTEIRRILDQCYAETESLLREHEAELVRVAEALLVLETIDGEQFEALYTGTKTVEEIRAEVEEETRKREEANKIEAEARAKRRERQRGADHEEKEKPRHASSSSTFSTASSPMKISTSTRSALPEAQTSASRSP